MTDTRERPVPVPAPTSGSRRRLTPAERRRRKLLLAWIPAGLGAIVIIAAIAYSSTLVSQGVGKPVALNPGFSKFSPAGIKNIDGTAYASFNLSKLPLTAAALHLKANGARTLGPYYGTQMDVRFVHGETTELFPDKIRVVTSGGTVTSIGTSIHASDFSEMHTAVYGLAIVGIDQKSLAAFFDSLPLPRADTTLVFDKVVGTGNALGVPTTFSVTCAGKKWCTVTSTTRLDAH